MHFIEQRYADDPTNWWVPNAACAEAMLRSAGFEIVAHPEQEVYLCRRRASRTRTRGAVYPAREAANAGGRHDRSRDDLERAEQQVALGSRTSIRTGACSPRWRWLAGAGDQGREPAPAARARRHVADRSALHAEHGGARACCDEVDAVAVHGFPLDWNHWQIHEWPDKLDEIQAVTDLPVWVSEVGVSTFGAEEVQDWGLQRTAELLIGKAPRIHWYSLYDLPRAWPATTRHREAEGSSYYRHFYMGLLREDGTPKLALRGIRASITPELGICQWFHFEDHRLDDAVAWLKRLGVTLSAHRALLGRQLPPERARLVRPPDGGARRTSTSPSPSASRPSTRASSRTTPARRIDKQEFAEFCAAMIRRYAPRASAGCARLRRRLGLTCRARTPRGRSTRCRCWPIPRAGPSTPRRWWRCLRIRMTRRSASACSCGAWWGCTSSLSQMARRDRLWTHGPMALPMPRAMGRRRRDELVAALAAAGGRQLKLTQLDVPDQSVADRLTEVTRLLLPLLDGMEVVFTHAYEGGHPDHDGVAFAVHAACARPAAGRPAGDRGEPLLSPGHAASSWRRDFAPCAGTAAIQVPLGEEETALKARMIAAHATQARRWPRSRSGKSASAMLRRMTSASCPMAGRLWYERFDWGLDGKGWLARVAQARRELSEEDAP